MTQQFGRYIVVDEIGRGSSGIVYRGKDPLMDRFVAIKTLHTTTTRDPKKKENFLKRFYREARASGVLTHPNIVTIFDFGEEGNIPYLAMEYLSGITLAQKMKECSLLAEGVIPHLLEQISAAIDYAHSQGVIHRDIKPGNVMCCEKNYIKVMDFSIARIESLDTGTITTSGTILGTPYYMPPEQIESNKPCPSSDVYSFGVMTYEMLTGALPFPGSNIASIIYRVLKEDPIRNEKLQDLAKHSTSWEDVFLKVLAKKPEDRFKSASEFFELLSSAYQLSAEPRDKKKKKFTDFGVEKTRLLDQKETPKKSRKFSQEKTKILVQPDTQRQDNNVQADNSTVTESYGDASLNPDTSKTQDTQLRKKKKIADLVYQHEQEQLRKRRKRISFIIEIVFLALIGVLIYLYLRT